MADSFAQMIPDARAFLSELAKNNTKDWWIENKSVYDAQLKSPALLLLDVMADKLRKLTGDTVTTKLFRPHRDVRFSKDKTPYNTHLHMAWMHGAGKPGYFLGISPTYIRLGMGMMAFDKDALLNWRTAIDQGTAVISEIDSLLAAGYTMDDPELKRVPAPFAKDHPNATLLRRKGCTVWTDLDPTTDDLSQAVQTHFERTTPLSTAIVQAIS